eukprot:scaffold1395_cov152-Amphora_coffeaeformis.AAC.15
MAEMLRGRLNDGDPASFLPHKNLLVAANMKGNTSSRQQEEDCTICIPSTMDMVFALDNISEENSMTDDNFPVVEWSFCDERPPVAKFVVDTTPATIFDDSHCSATLKNKTPGRKRQEKRRRGMVRSLALEDLNMDADHIGNPVVLLWKVHCLGRGENMRNEGPKSWSRLFFLSRGGRRCGINLFKH